MTVLVFKNKIIFATSSADAVIDDNYDRLSYGLCVFCSPDDCQNEYEDYLAVKESSDEPAETIADLDLTRRFTLPYLTDFTTVEEYAHRGVTKDECLTGSLVALLPYIYLLIWQIHFLVVAKTFHEAGKFANKRRQIVNWRRASSEMHRAGLHHPSIDNPLEFREAQEAAVEAIQVESLDDQDSSNRNLFPSGDDSNRNLGVDSYPSL